MKRLAVALLLTIFITPAFAGDIRLQWNDANPPETQITKYTVKWGTATGIYPNKVEVLAPLKEATIPGFVPGKYFFIVTASNAWGESGNSNETSTPPGLPGVAPGNLSILIIVTVTTP